ncbi:alkylation response protein AidB-like acyl-CoA dehydrogenase [Saccharothrix ecbatanensis]|uniref:Alkylation response protein AidB-like acyl-CoA dehydrogenase n=1 Tax=Saccharothrix ecbatanensis TaxID=1105145 RepID=A0A7W9HGW9_9PSEU|nr:hypothetical protein [Saccharothrix ecbatanensis]MBB5802072.1 alkylation response protein AidB-like acyl-CoA dehydrogenase [Saccharothrix ecbatanensis]
MSAADLMFTGCRPLFATASGGRVTAVPGGVVVSGRWLYDSVCDTLHSAGLERRPLTALEAATVGRDRAYLARLCVRAVHRLVELSGTAAHFEDHPIARHWRDLHMMSAHRDVNWATHARAHARAHAELTLETRR